MNSRSRWWRWTVAPSDSTPNPWQYVSQRNGCEYWHRAGDTYYNAYNNHPDAYAGRSEWKEVTDPDEILLLELAYPVD